jgi:phosphatidylethanolamine/phosphatidyl-N-methylethanolamine N-methyltransferase
MLLTVSLDAPSLNCNLKQLCPAAKRSVYGLDFFASRDNEHHGWEAEVNSEEWLKLPANEMMRAWYEQEYSSLSYSGATGLGQRLMHRTLEREYGEETVFSDVLEVGANRGEHLDFVKHKFNTYVLSDLVDRRTGIEKELHEKAGIPFVCEDVCNLSWRDSTFDRVLHVCLLHHVADPEKALGEMRRVLKPGGVLDIFLPSDPGFLFRLAKEVGPVRSARRRGLGEVKRIVDARDHRNHIAGLSHLTKHVFRDDSVVRRTYPVPGFSWNSSIWMTYRVTKAS